MKYLFLELLLLLLSSCIAKYNFNCNDKNRDKLSYKIIGIEDTITFKNINENFYRANILLYLNDSITIISYDAIASKSVEICKKENIIEGYFFRDTLCIYDKEILNKKKKVYYETLSKVSNCYIGKMKINPKNNQWKSNIDCSDFEFFYPPSRVKF